MKVIKGLPQNIELIKRFLPINKQTIFCFGDTIYAQEHDELPPDLIVHEEVHSKQQEAFGSVENWWLKYVTDAKFRFEQELDAYAVQYRWLKDKMPAKGQKEALVSFGQELALPQYQLYYTSNELSSKIRNRANSIVV